MKNRLIFYFLFLPFILFMAWSGIGNVLNNLLPISVAVIISVIILALFKTPVRKMFRTVLLVVMMVAVTATPKPAKPFFYISALVTTASFIGNFTEGAEVKQAWREGNGVTAPFRAWGASIESGFNAIGRFFGSEAAEAKHKRDMKEGARKAAKCLQKLNEKSSWSAEDREEYAKCSQEYADFLAAMGNKTCPTVMKEIKSISKNCWVCKIANTLISATEGVMTRFHKRLNKHKIPLTVLAFGLFAFLMFHFLGLVMSLGTADIGQFFTTMFQKILLVMFVATLFYFPYSKTIDLFLTPLFSFGAALTQKLNEQAEQLSNPDASLQAELKKLNGGNAFWASCDSCNRLAAGTSSSSLSTASNVVTPISPAMKDSIDCMLCNLYITSAIPSGMGSSLACAAGTSHKIDDFPLLTFPNIQMLLIGWVVRACFFIVSLIFAIAAFDSIFRLTFLFVLLPIFMTAAAFKSTRQYTVNAFNMFLHAIWTLFVLTLISQIVMSVFYNAFEQETTISLPGISITRTLAQITAEAIYDNDIDTIYQSLNLTPAFWMSVFVVVLSYFLTQISKSLIDALGPDGSQQISSSDSASDTAKGTVGLAYAPISYAKKWKEKHDEIKEEDGDSNKVTKRNDYSGDALDKTDNATNKTLNGADKLTDKAFDAAAKTSDKMFDGLDKGSDALCDKLTAGCAQGGITAIFIPLIYAVKYSVKAVNKTAKFAVNKSIKAAKFLKKQTIKATKKVAHSANRAIKRLKIQAMKIAKGKYRKRRKKKNPRS